MSQRLIAPRLAGIISAPDKIPNLRPADFRPLAQIDVSDLILQRSVQLLLNPETIAV